MPESFNPDTIIEESQNEKSKIQDDAKVTVEWFIDRCGELFKRSEAAESISEHIDSGISWANRCITALVNDIVDPVQQVVKDGERYVGAISYEEYHDIGAYRYTDVDDIEGDRQRIVCARCVDVKEKDNEIAHTTQGVGSIDEDSSIDNMKDKISEHYEQSHNVKPSEVNVGATLLSGTTISGNTAWHDGNVSGESNISIGATSVSVSPQGSGSGLDADTVDGQQAADIGGGITASNFARYSATATDDISLFQQPAITGMSLESNAFICNVNVDASNPSYGGSVSYSYAGGALTSAAVARLNLNSSCNLTVRLNCMGIQA